MKLPTLFILALSLINCTPKQNKADTSKEANAVSADTTKIPIGFHKLEKLSVTGDFDGDKKTDTVYQHNFSNLEKKEIQFSPDPMKIDWDEVVKWFYAQDSDITLSGNKKNSDVLHLGTGQGLYCLINIGDTNKDGKDELAFAIDKCDDSRTNTCKIYTLCAGKWQLLKEFGIREDAFDWEGETQPKFNAIRGYLEKQNNVWKHIDNDQNEYDTANEAGQMKALSLNMCT